MAKHLISAAFGALVLSLATPAGAGSPDASAYLTLKNHRFTPATLIVPKATRVRVNLVNQDAATEEFDSHDLRVEQLVTPHGRASFVIGPLNPGTYTYVGEFHSDTARGQIVVRER